MRRWWGCDIDEEAVSISRQRLAAVDGESDEADSKAIVTAHIGNNAVLIREVAAMYLTEGMKVADVTWGKGAFWREIDTGQYEFHPSDIHTSAKHPYDFRNLPYDDGSMDAVVLDPPYAHNPGSMMVDDNYANAATTSRMYHADIMQLYRDGLLEAKRVLMKGGLLLVKCQDEVESSSQRRSHMEIHAMAIHEGLKDEDLFVLVQPRTPAIQFKEQKHARKNHSFLWVFRK